MNYTNSQLSQWSGENEIKQAPKFDVPIIKLDGEKGGYYLLIDKDSREDLGPVLTGVILKVRRVVKGYREEDEITYYSREYDNWQEKVELFEARTGKDGKRKSQMVDCGTYKELKEKSIWAKTLNLNMILYVSLPTKENLYKIVVRGKGVSHLFDYFKEFEGENHIYTLNTVFGQNEEQHPRLKKRYYAMTFKQGNSLKEEEMDLIAEEMKKVHDGLEKVKQYHLQRRMEFEAVEKERSLPVISGDEIPVVDDSEAVLSDEDINEELQIEAEKDEEINIKDVPF